MAIFLRFWQLTLGLLSLTCITSCSTLGETSLPNMLENASTLTLPFETSDRGLMVVEMELPEIGRGKFILDTGATTSAIYRQSVSADVLFANEGEPVRVYDMLKSEIHQTINVPSLQIGGSTVPGAQFAIIEQAVLDETILQDAKGVLGLDLMSSYRLYVDAQKQEVSFIDDASGPVQLNREWVRVPLTKDPYGENALGLHFVKLEVNKRQVFALLDTGSSYNAMNWNFNDLKPLKRYRRKLEKKWEYNGALGQFKPEGLATIQGIKSSGHDWPVQDFIVFELYTFDQLGLEGKPLMIAGAPFFKGIDFLIDFPKNELWLHVGGT